MRKILRKLMILGIVSSLTAGVISGCGQETKAESAYGKRQKKQRRKREKVKQRPRKRNPGQQCRNILSSSRTVSAGLC